MKKILGLVLTTLFVLLISACSSHEDFVGDETNLDKTTLRQLKEYNYQKIAEHGTRAYKKNNSTWRKNLPIVFADCVGAGRGVKWGHSFAIGAGAVSGGAGYFATTVAFGATVGSVCSYIAYLKLYGYAKRDYDLTTNGPLFLNAKSSLVNSLDYYKGNVGNQNVRHYILSSINIPSGFEQLLNIGENHNGFLLETVEVKTSSRSRVGGIGGGLIGGPISGGLEPAKPGTWKPSTSFSPDKMKLLLENDSLTTLYNGVSKQQQTTDFAKNIDENFESDNVRGALKLYLSLLDNVSSDMDDVATSINDYIKIIENNTDFTYEDKMVVFSSMIVSLYSSYLWNNELVK